MLKEVSLQQRHHPPSKNELHGVCKIAAALEIKGSVKGGWPAASVNYGGSEPAASEPWTYSKPTFVQVSANFRFRPHSGRSHATTSA